MPLPDRLERDVEALREAGHSVDVVEDGTRFYVIVEGFELPDGYVPAVTDLMMIADYQYNQSALDMFWTSPHVRCVGGAWPQAADQFCEYAGRTWQRWSWHYAGWNPTTHNLITHLETCRDRLLKGS
jgi:hypothetical protein